MLVSKYRENSAIMDKLTIIKTPNSYIRMSSNKTLLQQQSLLMVSAHLQDYIKQFFELGLHQSNSPIRPLFTQYMLDHGIPPFKIYLADMGIRAQNYQTVRQAINEINAVVDYPEVDDDGHKTGKMLFVPVFKLFRVPEHYGYIEVEINPEAAKYAFNMAQGYISHPKDIARYATKRSTPPLYFKLLQEHCERIQLTVPQIKKAIGMEPFKDDATGEWVVPYAKFAHFKTKVLDAEKADLDRMAKDNHTDITFDYVPVYLNGRKRGDPDYIEFTIQSTGLGIGYSLLTRKDTPATGEAKREERAMSTGELWERCKEDMLRRCTIDNSRRIISSLQFCSWNAEAHTLLLNIGSMSDYQWIVQPQVSGDLVRPLLMRYFGSDVQWMYNVPKG